MSISDIVSQKKNDALQKLAGKISEKEQAEQTANEQLLTAQYKTLVISSWIGYTGLPPSDAELNSWVTLLLQGAPSESLYRYLSQTPEYLGATFDRTYLIHYVFSNLYGRQPTPEEVQYWWGAAGDYRFVPTLFNTATGKDLNILTERVVFSELALSLIGGSDPSDVAYRQLFDYLLDTINPTSGRTADDAVVALNNVLNPNTPTYFDTVVQPVKEQGYETALQLAFLAYMRRPPSQFPDTTADEYDTWMAHLKKTNGDLSFLVQSLVGSNEFLQPYYDKDLAQSIADLIKFLFGREATPQEVDYWYQQANAAGVWLPWYITQSATGADRASLNEKLIVSTALEKIAEQYGLYPSDPNVKPIVVDLLAQTHLYPGGQSATQVMVGVDQALGKGTKPTPAKIESVSKVGEYLSISFDQTIDWRFFDKNGDGVISVGSELIIDVKASWKISENPDNPDQPQSVIMSNPLGVATVYEASGGRLVLKLGSDADMLVSDGNGDGITDTLQIDQVIILGVRDLDGQISDVIFP
ncbi:hypothetical protein K1I42_06690 [Hydrogenophilus thermoluteolus]|nr:hypothetical protein [Hydrogenophilus thermoluteolus]MBW7656977.1 hypothetical protein [Hydrogenophilus thermoluteolus]